MATVWYCWQGFIHRGTTFMYLQYSHPLIYHLLPNVWKALYTISVSIFVDVPYCLLYSTDKFITCVVLDPSQWFFHFVKEIIITWTKAFYSYKPCCDKKSNTVGSLILWETESPIRAKHNIDQRHLLWKTVMMLEWISYLISLF